MITLQKAGGNYDSYPSYFFRVFIIGLDNMRQVFGRTLKAILDF